MTVGGVIYLPTRDELFTAIRHQGAFLNKNHIEVSQIAAMSEAIIHVGDFMKENDARTRSEGLQDFSHLAKQARRIRMIGTAATDLAYLACGRADALVNHAAKPWDVEAGKLLVLEAGGETTTLQRNSKPLAIYSNKALHQTVKNLLLTESEATRLQDE